MNLTRSGFTLIELLVVMSIVALLLTIALPRYMGSLDKAKDIALIENLKVVRSVADRFHSDKGRYPEDLKELVEQNYLRELPMDPITERSDTWVLIMSPHEGGGFLDIRSGATGVSRQGRPYGEY